MMNKKVAMNRVRVVLENLKTAKESLGSSLDPVSWAAFVLEFVHPVVMYGWYVFPKDLVRRAQVFHDKYVNVHVQDLDTWELEEDAEDLWRRICNHIPNIDWTEPPVETKNL